MKVLLHLTSVALCATGVSSFSIPFFTKPASSATRLCAEANGASASSPKKVIVLGGDGFCGWPTCLYLSDQGHDVVMVDNLSRRNIDIELGCDSLTPIQSPEVSANFVITKLKTICTAVDESIAVIFRHS
jgi:UDP-sulfoquinovose synthase